MSDSDLDIQIGNRIYIATELHRASLFERFRMVRLMVKVVLCAKDWSRHKQLRLVWAEVKRCSRRDAQACYYVEFDMLREYPNDADDEAYWQTRTFHPDGD